VSGNGSFGVSIETGTVLGNTINQNVSGGIAAIANNAKVGVGNNTIVDNGSPQIFGSFAELHPNRCFPGGC
jgi:hypothetical protein